MVKTKRPGGNSARRTGPEDMLCGSRNTWQQKAREYSPVSGDFKLCRQLFLNRFCASPTNR